MYFFDENDEYFRYPAGAVKHGGALDLKVKVKRGAASGARVYVHRDLEPAQEIQMRFASAAGSYDVYECEVSFQLPGLYWYHILVDIKDQAAQRIPETDGHNYQVTVFAPPVKQPDWLKGGMIYHIFVDRFFQGGKLNLRQGAIYREDWGGTPYYKPDEKGIVHNSDFFGGDLFGVIKKLPYLQKLGVTCIYLSPVFQAASNHKYDTGDFMKIDPAFGGDEALEKLCVDAKKAGIHVILDGVFNHVGIDSVYFNKYNNYDSVGAYQSDGSPYKSWFLWRDDGTYESWWGIELLPAVDKSSQEYRDFICGKKGVIAHWTKKGVSGWRLDVVDELPDVFLDPLCHAVKREKKDALIVGEVWEDASNKIAYDVRRRYFLGGQLDSVTNYPLKNAIIDFIRNGNVGHLAAAMDSLCRNYPQHVLDCLMNILGTHDTARILTVLSGLQLPLTRQEMEHFKLDAPALDTAKRRLRLAAALQYTLPGVPCVYYGDEAGMEGGADPFNRRCYPWGKEDKKLLAWYEKLSSIRKQYSCFKDGKYELIQARDGVFAFTRGKGKKRVLIAVNITDDECEIKATDFNYNVLKDCKADALKIRACDAAIYAIK